MGSPRFAACWSLGERLGVFQDQAAKDSESIKQSYSELNTSTLNTQHLTQVAVGCPWLNLTEENRDDA
jgi:hypothetical protein